VSIKGLFQLIVFGTLLSSGFEVQAQTMQPMTMPQGVSEATAEAAKLKAAQQQNHADLVQKADGIVRLERAEPKNQKRVIDFTSGTGSMTATGVERDTTNLTDAEKVLSENFIHDGLANRIVKEECQGDNALLCRGQDPSTRSMMIQALAKAYSMVIGMAGGKLKPKGSGSEGGADGGAQKAEGSSDGKSAEGGDKTADNGGKGDSEKKDKEMNDYCRFVAIGTETFATFQQQFAQAGLTDMPTNADTQQRDTLLKAAISHEERAKQAKTQTIGWGATAACYWTMIAFAQLDWQLGLKIGGSTLLAGFFHSEIKRHEGFADKIRGIADMLPGKGDCNPITERLCYCAQPETMKDPTHCINEMRQNHINQNAYMTMTCLDNRMQTDPACRCLETESCFDKKIENDLRGIGFGNLEMQGIRPIQEMSRGSLSAGTLNSAERNIGALGNRLDRSPEIKKLLESRPLTGSQKENYDKLIGSGLSPSVARLMAIQPNVPGSDKNLGLFSGSGDFNTAGFGNFSASNRGGSRDGSLYFSGGYGLQYSPTTETSETINPFDKFKQNPEGERGPSNVLEFAERAERSAQITTRPDTLIFDIISHRYRQSAWNRLPMNIED